jgi:alkylation response protein AidB-like acyl-CoA dehydrogenase
MDFKFTEEQESFRREIRDFIDAELPPDWIDYIGPTIDDVVVDTDKGWQVFKDMAQKMGKKGWLSLFWPEEYGGKACSNVDYLVFLEEIARRGSPGFNAIGAKMLAPTILVYGTEEQKEHHLGPIARGDQFWCEGFSEPEAGSDLASLKTLAIRNGDYFIVNGQKTWSTFANYSDWCGLLARSDKESRGRDGLSFLLVDLSTPGVSVNPIYNILNEPDFCDIFFEDVRVPVENLLGVEHQGWKVAQTFLSFERVYISPVSVVSSLIERLALLLKETSGMHWTTVKHKLAGLQVEVEIGRLICYKVAWLLDRGEATAWHAALSRLYSSQLIKRAASEAMEMLGCFGTLDRHSKWAPLKGWVEHLYLSSRGMTIAAGTSEIHRNIIALRGLGLPRG